MKLYRLEMHVIGTAYIKARSPADAMKKGRALKGKCLAAEAGEGDVYFNGARFEDCPPLSFSPVMTIYDPAEETAERTA